MNRLAIIFCSCFILIAGYNFLQAVAAFYIATLTVDQNSSEFKNRRNEIMALFDGKKWTEMVKKQGKKLEQMVI